MLTDAELGALVLMLQSSSPLERLSNMEARTVIELMQQRGYKISVPKDRGCGSGRRDCAPSLLQTR
jgi:hypothetical protein